MSDLLDAEGMASPATTGLGGTIIGNADGSFSGSVGSSGGNVGAFNSAFADIGGGSFAPDIGPIGGLNLGGTVVGTDTTGGFQFGDEIGSVLAGPLGGLLGSLFNRETEGVSFEGSVGDQPVTLGGAFTDAGLGVGAISGPSNLDSSGSGGTNAVSFDPSVPGSATMDDLVSIGLPDTGAVDFIGIGGGMGSDVSGGGGNSAGSYGGGGPRFPVSDLFFDAPVEGYFLNPEGRQAILDNRVGPAQPNPYARLGG